MHENNRKWLVDLKKEYPNSFNNCRVLEIGSLNVNGTVRDYFTDCDFTGVDIEEGKDVDVVGKNIVFEAPFDTIVSFNAFEHDFDWKHTLKHYLKYLKKGGYLFLNFGAEGNPPHSYPVWKFVPHVEFVNYCLEIGLTVIDNFFEEDRYGENVKGAYSVICKL